MGRPRGKNFEKNLYYRTPPHLREQLKQSGAPKDAKEQVEKIHEPSVEGIQEFRKSNFYAPVKQVVEQSVKLNNKIHDIMESQKDRKDPIYTDELVALRDRGIMVRPIYRISTDDLRNIAYSSSLIGAIHQIVSDDASIYCQYLEDPGFKFKMKEAEEEVTPALETEMKEWAKFLLLMGDKSISDWRERDRFHEVIEMATRDTLAIDSVAYQRSYNRLDRLADVRYLDPGTIYQIDRKKGYEGDKNITHVQMIRGRVTETWEEGRLVYRHKNNLSDIRMRGFGFSPIEQCILEIMSLLFTVKHNGDRFNSRNPPKVLLTSENTINANDQARLELEWENAFHGPREGFKIPMMFGAGKMQVHKLDVSDDFEFDKMMQIVSSFIIAAHGVDPAQLGLKLNNSQALSEASMDGRQHFSRDRMHGAIMGFHQDCLNELIDPPDDLPYRMIFSGVKTEDANKRADLSDKEFKSFKSLDELRKERDMPTMAEEAEEYRKAGIYSEKEAKKHAKLGALRGNQYYSQAFTSVIAESEGEGGGMPGMDPGGESGGLPEGGDDLPWGEEDFGEFE